MNSTNYADLQNALFFKRKGMALWFTGLSGSGKTTLAKGFHTRLRDKNIFSVILDGDELRKGINAQLGFTPEDRAENIRRIAEIAKIIVDNGIVCLVSTISPYPKLRSDAREIIGDRFFTEIFINAPLSVCEERDVKGLYKRARDKAIPDFTGIQDKYIPPGNPDLEIRTDLLSEAESIELMFSWFRQKIILSPVPDNNFN